MESQEELYEKLRRLYAGEEMIFDSFSVGREIEEIVNTLFKDLVSPSKQEFNVRIGNYRLDGKVQLSRWRIVFYEIFAGDLSDFRYERLQELSNAIFVTRRIYLVVIARSFSEEDRKRINALAESLKAKNVTPCFMDYKALISLHKYATKIEATPRYENLRTLKNLFLESVFEHNLVIQKESFDDELASAKKCYMEKSAGSPVAIDYHRSALEKYEFDEYKLQNLEELLEKALHEIRDLRKELRERRLNP